MHRFLARTHRVFVGDLELEEPTKEQLRLLHHTIKRVTIETDQMRFNTAIAAMMEFINAVMFELAFEEKKLCSLSKK